MRLQKTLVETQQFPNGEIQAVLYDNNDKVVRVVMIDEEGEPILSDKERKAISQKVYQSGNEYIVKNGQIYLDDKEVSNFEGYFQLKPGINIHITNC